MVETDTTRPASSFPSAIASRPTKTENEERSNIAGLLSLKCEENSDPHALQYEGVWQSQQSLSGQRFREEITVKKQKYLYYWNGRVHNRVTHLSSVLHPHHQEEPHPSSSTHKEQHKVEAIIISSHETFTSLRSKRAIHTGLPHIFGPVTVFAGFFCCK